MESRQAVTPEAKRIDGHLWIGSLQEGAANDARQLSVSESLPPFSFSCLVEPSSSHLSIQRHVPQPASDQAIQNKIRDRARYSSIVSGWHSLNLNWRTLPCTGENTWSRQIRSTHLATKGEDGPDAQGGIRHPSRARSPPIDSRSDRISSWKRFLPYWAA